MYNTLICQQQMQFRHNNLQHLQC
uniref:Uncharacterized protein n=1 Tax=Arundo donax TaxID=35708 RepID=A0A0A9DWX4_ARUDO